MRVALIFLALLLTATFAEARSLKKELERSLKESAQRGVMFGHHDDTMYGYNWRYTGDGRSDAKEVTGQYPAMMSFDLSDIDKGFRNRPQYDRMREEIRRQHARGGYVTLSWHASNPITGQNAWNISAESPVRDILPGGSHHAAFLSVLDHAAEFFLSLTDEKGQPIPVIFRPWHECNGDWFWWGCSQCTPEEYKALWRLTAKHLKKRGVTNVIYAYSPGERFNSAEEYLKRYPGDNIISVMGVEGYAVRATGDNRSHFIRRIRHAFDIVAPLARQRNKILAFTETGTKHNSDPQWWTQSLLPAISGYPVCYMVVWRNAYQNDDECYGVYKGHLSESDFRQFSKNPYILFVK
jgi:mannan endo-1,4-beta-mannosidase